MKEQKPKTNITIDNDVHFKLEELKLQFKRDHGSRATMSSVIDDLIMKAQEPVIRYDNESVSLVFVGISKTNLGIFIADMLNKESMSDIELTNFLNRAVYHYLSKLRKE